MQSRFAATMPATFARPDGSDFYRVGLHCHSMKQFLLVLVAFLFAACSRSGVVGTYQTVGGEDKFNMTLEVREDGRATFFTRSNRGDGKMDIVLQTTMSIAEGRWTKDGPVISVTGIQGDGKPGTYRFVRQENGDLLWEKNGARFVKKPK